MRQDELAGMVIKFLGESEMSITEFATKVGVSRPLVYHWINTMEIPPKHEQAISRVFQQHGNLSDARKIVEEISEKVSALRQALDTQGG